MKPCRPVIRRSPRLGASGCEAAGGCCIRGAIDSGARSGVDGIAALAPGGAPIGPLGRCAASSGLGWFGAMICCGCCCPAARENGACCACAYDAVSGPPRPAFRFCPAAELRSRSSRLLGNESRRPIISLRQANLIGLFGIKLPRPCVSSPNCCAPLIWLVVVPLPLCSPNACATGDTDPSSVVRF